MMARRSWDCSGGAAHNGRSRVMEEIGPLRSRRINGFGRRARDPIPRHFNGLRMSCPRCEGFIIREYLVDPRQGSLSGVQGWRCVNCGAVGDNLIQTNRKRLFPVRCMRSPIEIESFPSHSFQKCPILDVVVKGGVPQWAPESHLLVPTSRLHSAIFLS